jgi:hypothetical protein
LHQTAKHIYRTTQCRHMPNTHVQSTVFSRR